MRYGRREHISLIMQQVVLEYPWDGFPKLHTERLDLIEINETHLGDLYKLFGDEEAIKHYDIVRLKNEQEARYPLNSFIKRFNDKYGIRWGIALKGNQNIIGTIGFNRFTRYHRGVIGYDLQANYWNKGYMTEAVSKVIGFGFEQLELNRIEAEVRPANIGSKKVLEKLNFINEGVLRQWWLFDDKYFDCVMFALLKMNYDRGEGPNR